MTKPQRELKKNTDFYTVVNLKYCVYGRDHR